jgi:hypothetical protein
MEPLWSQEKLAMYWGYSVHTLESWRTLGIGPQFISLIGAIHYRVKEIHEFEALIQQEQSKRKENFNDRRFKSRLSSRRE